MKTFLIYILASWFLLSCSNKDSKVKDAICGSCHLEEEFKKVSIELEKFDSIIIGLYNQIETSPDYVILETQRILNDVNNSPDTLLIKSNKLYRLNDLRVETYYRMGEYKKSIEEIKNFSKYENDNFLGESHYIQLACNYVKLKDLKKAEEYLSQAGKGWYITEYINANFYEVLGEKELAIKKYEEIESDILMDHYYHYKHAQKRLIELNKPNPKLLTELFFPTDRPDAEITISDKGIRKKMFDTIYKLPECKNCSSVSVFKQPNQLKSSKYWFKAFHKGSKVAKYDFLIDTLTFEIMVYDTISKTKTPISVWRNKK